MRCRRIAPLLLLAAGCVGGDAISPPRPVDAAGSADDASPPADAAEGDAAQTHDAADPGDASVTCVRAQLGEWTGASVMKDGGGETWSSVRADVRWVLESSEGCIDRYRPTGVVTFQFEEPCDNRVEPSHVPVAPTDGVLTIDRTRQPVTYEIRGATTWQASVSCEGDTPEPPMTVGGPWALGRGSFDGDVIAGGFYDRDSGADWWDYRRADVELPDDAPGCAEPPIDHLWGTGFVSGGAEASITWTRVATSGCSDTFKPSGVATAPTQSAMCTSVWTEPPSAPIASSDGELVIHRHANPILLEYHGDTSWPGARTCRQPDGTMYIEHGVMGGPWAWSFVAVMDGTAYSGSTTMNDVDYAWSITRLPPAAASSPAP